MNLIIRYTKDCFLSEDQFSHVISLNTKFNLLEHTDEIKRLTRLFYEKIYLDEIPSSLLTISYILASFFYKKETKVFIIKSNSEFDITKNINNLFLDFHDLEIKSTNISDTDELKLLQSLHSKYFNMFKENDFLFPHKTKKQSDVINLFENVGLCEDLIMRDPELSNNKYWCYPLDNTKNKLVFSRDLRLWFANFINSKVGDKSKILEIGSGTGSLCHYLDVLGHDISGLELSKLRCESATFLGKIKNTNVSFTQGSVDLLPFPDNSFEWIVSCFALEQCGEIIDCAIKEILRVSSKGFILLEPSVEHYTTVVSFIHNSLENQVSELGKTLERHNVCFTVEKPRFQHYYNPGAIYQSCHD